MLASITRTVRPWLNAAGPSGRDALAVFVIRVGWLALEFLIAVLLARLLGARGYGAYAIGLAAATLVGAVATLGLDRLLVRQVALLRDRSRAAVAALQRRATRLALAASLLGAALLALLSGVLAGDDATVRTVLLYAAPLVPLIAIARLRQGTLQGLGRPVLGQLPEMLLQPAVMLVGIAAVLLGAAQTVDAAIAIRWQTVAACAALLLGIVTVRGAVGPAGDAAQLPPEHATTSGALLRDGAPFLVLLAMGLALTQTDTLLIGLLQDPSAAGPYRAASQIAALIAFPMTAINLALAPRLAAAWGSGDRDMLQRLATQAARAGFGAALGVALMISAAAAPLLTLFGAEFAPARPALGVLTLAFIVNTLTGTAGYMLIMTEHAGTAARWFALAAGVAIGSQWLLIPLLGTVGAALGTLVGLALLAFGLTRATRRLLGIHTGLIGR
jgi:O-antigen/teichoic acid export membrane protein